MAKADLKIDWATHEAAKYACKNWHYSGCLPVGKTVKIGIWEKGKFIGVVLFGHGANMNMLKSFHVGQDGGCELVRVAMREHITPVSRVVAMACRFLKKLSPGLQIVVSYADPEQGHHGGIYQAGNWVYTGPSAKAVKVWYKGKWSHKKTVDDAGIDYRLHPHKRVCGKHRYLMPLDKEMAEQIKPLAKPYPKREKQAMASFPEAQRQGSTDLYAPTLEGNGDTFSPLLADAS
tara:strand:- start:77 stop:775 length:699 start_codon:yes stop_codon:yes gene_type:complete